MSQYPALGINIVHVLQTSGSSAATVACVLAHPTYTAGPGNRLCKGNHSEGNLADQKSTFMDIKTGCLCNVTSCCSSSCKVLVSQFLRQLSLPGGWFFLWFHNSFIWGAYVICIGVDLTCWSPETESEAARTCLPIIWPGKDMHLAERHCEGEHLLFILLLKYLLKAYSPVNRTGSPQGCSQVQL